MKIGVANRQKDLRLSATSVRPIVRNVLEYENFETDEVFVYFVSTKEISRLHQKLFGDSSPTDCISLPLDDQSDQSSGYHILGEVFVCPKTAIDYLGSTDIDSVYKETTLYLVHSLLHLTGYEDTDKKKRMQMRHAEKRHMKRLIDKKILLKAP